MSNKIRKVTFPEMGPAIQEETELTTYITEDIEKILMDDENQDIDSPAPLLNES